MLVEVISTTRALRSVICYKESVLITIINNPIFTADVSVYMEMASLYVVVQKCTALTCNEPTTDIARKLSAVCFSRLVAT